MLFNIALNYGGRAEIVDAAPPAAIAAGVRRRTTLDEAAVRASLYTAGQPDPDLLIRTSGEMRVSNFLLWQIAYAEIWVTDTLWPDFRRRHLLEAVARLPEARPPLRRDHRDAGRGAELRVTRVLSARRAQRPRSLLAVVVLPSVRWRGSASAPPISLVRRPPSSRCWPAASTPASPRAAALASPAPVVSALGASRCCGGPARCRACRIARWLPVVARLVTCAWRSWRRGPGRRALARRARPTLLRAALRRPAARRASPCGPRRVPAGERCCC